MNKSLFEYPLNDIDTVVTDHSGDRLARLLVCYGKKYDYWLPAEADEWVIQKIENTKN